MDAGECMWTLDEDVRGDGNPCKVLMIILAKPEATEEETTWKKGETEHASPSTQHPAPLSQVSLRLMVCLINVQQEQMEADGRSHINLILLN